MINSEKEQATIGFRKATEKDIPSILEIEKESWMSVYPNEEEGITKQEVGERFVDNTSSTEFLRDSLQDTHNLIYLIEKDGGIVGYVHLLVETDYNDIVQIYLSPKHQRKGIGSAAMEYILKTFGDSKPIRLQVARYNPAVQFYEKYGFLKTEIPQPQGENWNILPSGKVIPIVVMERPANISL